MKAIIGLGNPEPKYDDTRHNIGFAIVDILGSSAKAEFKLNKRLFGQVAFIGEPVEQILLAKPITYMNDSGKAVNAIKNFYKISLPNILIIHDDVSLPLGKIRLQKHGGAGGQHGVESIISCLGGDTKFNRLKIGIGPDPGGERRADYVLQKFSGVEKKVLAEIEKRSIEAIYCWLTKGIDQAMNEFNGLGSL